MAVEIPVPVPAQTSLNSKETRSEETSNPDAMGSVNAPCYILPDLLRDWPYKRKLICPHYAAVKPESMEWLDSFQLFTPEAREAFDKAEFSLFPAMVYPLSTKYVHRSCTDLMYTFFVLDDLTDISDAKATRLHCEATMDAILNLDKPRPAGEHIVSEIARQFWKRASVDVPQVVKERFVASWKAYIAAVILQAQRRDQGHYVCTIEEYIISRRNDVGCFPCLIFLEISLGVNIPHHVMEHPHLAQLNRDVTDIVLLSNDIYSYKKEVLSDNPNYNSVTVIMKANKTTLAGAIQTISQMHDDVLEDFLKVRDDVLNKCGFPSFGEDIDRQVIAYVDGLCQFIYGHDEWYFSSGRYFGDAGLEIQKTRKVDMA